MSGDLNGKEALSDDQVLNLNAVMQFDFWGKKRTLLRTGFAVNRIMREIETESANYLMMPTSTNEEIDVVEEAEKELEYKIKEFLRLTVKGITKEELDVSSMNDFNLVSRQLRVLSQRAAGFNLDQINRMFAAEAEYRVKTLEEGKNIENLLKALEMAQQDQTPTTANPTSNQD